MSLKNSDLLTIHPIFEKASDLLIQLLKRKNQEQEITFLLPTKYISQEAVKVGALFDHLLNERSQVKTIYRTFFAFGYLDVISGVIKIIRHNFWTKSKGQQGSVLVYDSTGALSSFFNPLHSDQPLVPGVFFENSKNKILNLLKQEKWIGLIWCYENTDDLVELDKLFYFCKTQNIITALDESHLVNWYEEKSEYRFQSPPDIYIFGENLTRWEVPFGSFSMAAKIYEPWNNISNCLTHSSSYSGNTLSLSMILALFEKYYMDKIQQIPIQYNRKNKYKTYARYVNPVIGWIFYATYLSPEVKKAQGIKLLVETKKNVEEIIDVVAGSGCCPFGHNEENIVAQVLDKHDSSVDYWSALCMKLTELTSLKYVFPAVSGSSAVDIAIILGMLANPSKTRIITFKENYSGKSLISLNFTRFDAYRTPFHPFYFDIIEIDPFQEDSVEKLTVELTSGYVGLIWFEVLQGHNLDMIPDKILEVISKFQKEYDYLIGIDEILTGFFRTGNFLCSSKKSIEPDLIALGKGLSGGIFPQACVLISERVCEMARKSNSALVEWLQIHYINQMGAHVMLHGIETAISRHLSEQVITMEKLFRDEIGNILPGLPLYQEIRTNGLLIYLKLNNNAFPINILGEEVVEFLMSCFYLEKGKVFLLNSRLTMPLIINKLEIKELCRRIISVNESMNRFRLFLFCIKKMVKIYLLLYWQKISEFLKCY